MKPCHYEEFLWRVCAYHGHTEFSVLQYTWSDPASRFPWEKACDPSARRSPRLLFEPRQCLPLSEGE